jgi:formiminoglutamase
MSKGQFKPYNFIENKKTDLTLQALISKIKNPDVKIFGYPDDEGIFLNGGKLGAAHGPEAIRKALYKMTPTPTMEDLILKDEGDLDHHGVTLKERHAFASEIIGKNLEQKVISFGGGHDYGYVDGSAFLRKFKNNSIKPIVINFDAHFDLRNLDKGLSSGTPFFRLIEDFGNTFELFEIGIQKQCNGKSLFEYAKSKKNITTLDYESLYPDHSFNFDHFKKTLESRTTEKQDCFLSIDIDGFSSAFAPGCSQSWPTGFDVKSFFKMFDHIFDRFNVHILGIYEVSPPLDHEELTSRLAALITYRFLEKTALSKMKTKHLETELT